ncbi:MAG: ATP-binding protein [Acidobacteria bacterium]|nr:ATP-binding protein [Acidobacteriota bacterium]
MIAVSPAQCLASIRKRHLELMSARDGSPLSDSIRASIRDFLMEVVEAGAHIGIAADRADAQSVITYWTSVLQQDDPRPLSLVLDEFVPKSTGELAGRNPYRGLLSFRETDSELFFGRRDLVAVLLDRLRQSGSVALLGVSGSGKSSLVRAGLLPALRSGALVGSADWHFAGPMVPGTEPLAALRRILPDEDFVSTRILLFIDQFEEVFTLAGDKERSEFFTFLAALLENKDRYLLVLTMRSEYDTQFVETRLGDLVAATRVRVPSMSAAELTDAIERPAGMFGVEVDQRITQDLVRNIQNEPAGLPLLQFTMTRLWDEMIARTESRIEWEAYRQLGSSPQRILAEAADQAYKSLIPDHQTRCKALCLELVVPGATLEVTSRRRLRSEVAFIAPQGDMDNLIAKLVEAGLLKESSTEDQDGHKDRVIEFSHESVTRNWPELIRWVREELPRLRRRQLLRDTVQLLLEKRPVAFYSGDQLKEALDFPGLTAEEKVFLQACEAKQLRQRGWDAFAWLLIIAAVVVVYFYQQNRRLVGQLRDVNIKLAGAFKLATTTENQGIVERVEKTEVRIPTGPEPEPKPRILVFYPCATKADCYDTRLIATLMLGTVHNVMKDANAPKIYAADPSKFPSFDDVCQVRYFFEDDANDARRLAAALNSVSRTVVDSSNIGLIKSGKMKAPPKNHFEVWVGKKAKAPVSGTTGGPW